MAKNVKILSMDLTDSWEPRTVDKLNYNFRSILLALKGSDAASSDDSSITIDDVDDEISSYVGQGEITIKHDGIEDSFSVNQFEDVTIEIQSGGGGGGGGTIEATTKVLKGDNNGNAIPVQSGDLPNAVVNTADPDGAILILNNGSAS